MHEGDPKKKLDISGSKDNEANMRSHMIVNKNIFSSNLVTFKYGFKIEKRHVKILIPSPVGLIFRWLNFTFKLPCSLVSGNFSFLFSPHPNFGLLPHNFLEFSAINWHKCVIICEFIQQFIWGGTGGLSCYVKFYAYMY